MLLKTVLYCSILLLLNTPDLSAQASLQCYKAPKNRLRWALGIRTGISREYNKDFFQSELNSKNRGWTQQIYLQHDISRYFMLELQSMHQKSWKDVRAFTSQPGRVYSEAIIRNERLHNNIILHCLLPTSNDVYRVGIGVGFGVLYNWVEKDETYAQSGATIHSRNTTGKMDIMNVVGALTGSCFLTKNFFLSGQASYSNVTSIGVGCFSLNLGLEYKL